MGGLFSSPSMPSPPPTPPPAPNLENSAAQTDIAARMQAQALQRGRSSTLLTTGNGLENGPGTTSKTLLGR